MKREDEEKLIGIGSSDSAPDDRAGPVTWTTGYDRYDGGAPRKNGVTLAIERALYGEPL